MSIQLTPAERGAYGHFFALADPQSTGVVSGNSAVSFFALSGLPSPVLGTIWTLADKDNNGFLTPAHFSVSLRLIGHAQNGSVVTDDLVNQPGPLPTFKGVALPPHLSGAAGIGVQTPTRSSSQLLQQQTTGQGASEIRPDDRARYTRIFAGAGPQGGLLDGEKAKEIFVKSKLPFDKLGAIWNLADTKARGKLDLTDFIVGMHFIQSTMNGSLTSIPTTLPAGLYEKAAGGIGATPSSPLAAQMTGGSASGGHSFIARQMTGPGAPGSPVPSSIRSPSMLQPQRTGMFGGSSFSSNWAVSSVDKAKADQFFDGLDQENKGILEGQAAVPFFMQSGLNEATLAHVWDLSDITQSGTLTRDEFAVAMHLINLKLTGSDLPQELPANLIPPSLRNQDLPQAVNPQETDTQRDLFSLMDDDVDLPVSAASAFAKPAIAPTLMQNITGNGAAMASGTSKGAFDSAFDDDFAAPGPAASTTSVVGSAAPPSIVASPKAASFISPTPTGASAGTMTANRSALQQPFGDSSIEAANHRLALDSTQKSLSNLEQTKSELSRNVSSDASTIDDLKTRLDTVRMRHQTESEAVRALQDRHSAQAAELKKLREESVREESELSRLKQEKDEIEQALLKDREDVREMKRLVGERTKEKEAIKLEIEKFKKEARQQKGLLAIGKKQLTQSEADVTKAHEELQSTRSGTGPDDVMNEQEHAAHGEVPVTSPPSASRDLAAKSPAASVRSTNPFDRLPQPPATSPNTAALAAGGTVGAVAAGVGAATLAHHHESPPNATATAFAADQTTNDLEADPFGQTTQNNASAGATSSAPNGFDDNFGNDADTVAVIPPNGEPVAVNANQSFDDAFADLDPPSTTAPRGESTSGVLKEPGSSLSQGDEAPVPGGGDVAERDIEQSTPAPLAAATASSATPFVDETGTAPTAAPTVDEVVSGADTIPGFTSAEKGKGAEASEEILDGDDSSDEDEGPEDVEASNTHRMTGSPDEIGKGKSPLEDDGVGLTSAAPIASATAATDKFPAIDDESVTSKAPVPASDALSTAVPTTAATSTASSIFTAPAVNDDAEQGDAFHDATDVVTDRHESSTDVFGTPTPIISGDSGFAPSTHERFATALESATDVTGAPSSTSSAAAKARRAPPAVPARAGTGASASPFEGVGTTTALPATASASSAVAASGGNTNANPLDDFDAAFEDLGPSTSGGGGADVGNVTATSGFDDTFGESDGFDFVPSFSTNTLSGNQQAFSVPAAANGASAASGSVPARGSNAFDGGFDSAFDDAFDSGGKGAAPVSSVQPGAVHNASTTTGSGFSFDDAFIPAEAISTGRTPPTTAQGLPPAAPPRPSATSASAKAGDQAGALPDDAGPVKQLCSMGFSRVNVIKALEKSNYRTDKALERLLAQA